MNHYISIPYMFMCGPTFINDKPNGHMINMIE